MTVRLQFLSGPWANHSLDVAESVVLGRAPAHGLTVADPAMSSEHCRIFMHEGRTWIQDLDSTNGTEVNGATVQTAELKNGDRITIGETEMGVEMTRRDGPAEESMVAARTVTVPETQILTPVAPESSADRSHDSDRPPAGDLTTQSDPHYPPHPPRHGTQIMEKKRSAAPVEGLGGHPSRVGRRILAAALLILIGCALVALKGGEKDRNMVSPATIRAAARQFRQRGVTLTIHEPIGVERKVEPVTSGMPLPKGCVKDVARLCLLDASEIPVPCQFTEQCRWPDGSLKWVLLDFQASIGASNRAEYVLCSRRKQVAVVTPVQVQDTEAGLTLDTGHVTFGISTNVPGLISFLALNGRDLISSTNPVRAVLVNGNKRVFRSSRPDAVVVETQGPMRSTIRVSGHFLDDEGKDIFGGKVGYDLRVTAYAGKSSLKLDFTLRNDGWYGYRNEGKRRPRQWLYMRSLRLDIPTASGGSQTAKFADQTFSLEDGRPVDLTQWFMFPLGNKRGQRDIVFTNMPPHVLAAGMEQEIPGGFHYTWAAGGQMEGAKGKAAGWLKRSGGDGPTLALGVRRFWQNFPMGFSVRPDMLSYVMLPEGECWPRTRQAYDASTYQFEGGRRKTATLLLMLGDDGPGQKEALAALDAPLFARAPAEWYRDTGAVVPLGLGNPSLPDAEQVEAMKRYDRLQRAKVNAKYADPAGKHHFFKTDRWGKTSIRSLQEECPDIFCGYMNYGDLVWSFGYCSLYYGWPYSMLQQYLRLGDRDFLNVAEDMIRHRYDIDQYHVENTALHLGGFQRYEKGEHGHLVRQDRYNQRWEKNARPSHTWNRGLLLHWALTGDPRSLAAAEQNGRAFHRFLYGQHKLGEKEKLPWGEFRVPVWAIDNWLALYEYTGRKEWLDRANEVFTKTLLAMEQDNGLCGYIIKDGKQGAQFTGYMVEPVCRLHHLTGREDVTQFLKRVLDWQRKAGTVRGEKKNGIYYPIMWREDWDYEPDLDEKISIGVAHHYSYPLLDGYAYLYRVLQRPDDLAFSRRLFKEAVFYIMTDRVTDPTYRSPLGYHHLADVFGFTPKLRAWDGRYGQIYLYVEELAGRD